MIAWLRARLSRGQPPAAPRAEWRIDCQLLAPLKLSRWRTARRGQVVSLPAWQAIGLERAGKARTALGTFALPDDFGRGMTEQPAQFAALRQPERGAKARPTW